MWAAGGPTAGYLGVERQGFALVFIGGPWAGQASEQMGVHCPCGHQESGMRLWDGAQGSQVQARRRVPLSQDQGPSLQVSQPPQLFPGAHEGHQRRGAPAGHVRGRGQRSGR
eukprot:613213-Pyramimonas_sp.AAC.1